MLMRYVGVWRFGERFTLTNRTSSHIICSKKSIKKPFLPYFRQKGHIKTKTVIATIVSITVSVMVDDRGLVPVRPTHCKGCSPLDCFYALFPIKKEKPRSLSTSRLMVDDTGLEPVTLRTSSGCSYQLS